MDLERNDSFIGGFYLVFHSCKFTKNIISTNNENK